MIPLTAPPMLGATHVDHPLDRMEVRSGRRPQLGEAGRRFTLMGTPGSVAFAFVAAVPGRCVRRCGVTEHLGHQ